MVRLAIRGQAGLELCELEFERPGPSYTVHTIEALRKRNPDERLVFIIGADTVPELPTWRDAARLVSMLDWAVVARPGWDEKDISALSALKE